MPPVGDSSCEAGRRIEAFVQDRYQQFPHAELVAVAHGGVITDFLRNVFSFDGETYSLEEVASAEHLQHLTTSPSPDWPL